MNSFKCLTSLAVNFLDEQMFHFESLLIHIEKVYTFITTVLLGSLKAMCLFVQREHLLACTDKGYIIYFFLQMVLEQTLSSLLI